VCWCYVAELAVGDVVSECRMQPALWYHITNSQSRYITPTRLKSTQYSLHNNAPGSRKLLKMDVLTSKTCWAVNWHNKACVNKLVYLYSNKNAQYVHKKWLYLTLYCSLQDTSSAVITPRSYACIQESSSHPQPLSTTSLTLVPASFV